MSEELLHKTEETKEQESNPYGSPENRTKDTHESERHHEAESTSPEELKQISKKIEHEARPSKDLKLDTEDKQTNDSSAHGSTYEGYSGSQAIKRIQKHLKPAEKQFSKAIHNPAIEAVSDVVGATVARPSGIMMGGLFSLISSLAFYIFAKHYGYEYSYFIGIMFFVGGFILGILIELLIKPFRKK